MMPSSGKCSAARAPALSSGSSARACSPLTISAARAAPRAPRRSSSGRRRSSLLGQRHGQRADPLERRVQRGAQRLPAAGSTGAPARARACPAGSRRRWWRCRCCPWRRPRRRRARPRPASRGRCGARQPPRHRAADHSAADTTTSRTGACIPHPRRWRAVESGPWPTRSRSTSSPTPPATRRRGWRGRPRASSTTSEIELIRHARVKSREQLARALEAAAGRRAAVFYTLVDPGLREAVVEISRAAPAGRRWTCSARR